MIPTLKTEDLLLGMWNLIGQLGVGAAPVELGQREEHGAWSAARWGVSAFAGTLATGMVLLPPRDPESKGVLGRRIGASQTICWRRTGPGCSGCRRCRCTWADPAGARLLRAC
jgi:hypothetical protein